MNWSKFVVEFFAALLSGILYFCGAIVLVAVLFWPFIIGAIVDPHGKGAIYWLVAVNIFWIVGMACAQEAAAERAKKS